MASGPMVVRLCRVASSRVPLATALHNATTHHSLYRRTRIAPVQTYPSPAVSKPVQPQSQPKVYAGSDRSGQRTTFFDSLIVTAKLDGVDPQAWLADTLGGIAFHLAQSLRELLPWMCRPMPAAPARLPRLRYLGAAAR